MISKNIQKGRHTALVFILDKTVKPVFAINVNRSVITDAIFSSILINIFAIFSGVSQLVNKNYTDT